MAAPTLETPRLLLRPWRDEDVERWVAMGTDPQVMRYFPSMYSRERAEESAAWLRARLERNGFGWWVTEVKSDGSFAGLMELQTVPFEAAFTPAFEIGWRLVPEHWGRGYATEAARVLLRYSFEDLARTEVVAMTAAVNAPSRRVMERLGMTYDPRDDFDHPLVARDHELERHVLYRISAPGRH